MKLFKKLILSFLMVTLSVTGLVACGEDKAENEIKEQFRYDFKGVHEFTAPDIEGKYLVKDGVTEYTLIVPTNASNYLNNAKTEFVDIFKMATDITINTLSDNADGLTPGGKYISLGDTTLFKDSGLTYDKNYLTRDGIRIITSGETIYILGGTDRGVLYGVYDFMTVYFNWEFFYRNCWNLDTGVKNANLKNFDLTDIPDTKTRSRGNAFAIEQGIRDYELDAGLTARDGQNLANRYREINTNQLYMPAFCYMDGRSGQMNIHNSEEYVRDALENGTAYAEWFGTNGTQLCYTCRGNQEARDALIRHCADKVIYSLTKYPPSEYPYYDRMTFTHEDGGHMCTCDTCIEQKDADGGTYAGEMLRVTAEIMELVEEWMLQPENEYYRRDDFVLYFFAYGSGVNDPPVIKHEDGTFDLASEDLIMPDNVGVYLCLGGQPLCDYYDEERASHKFQVEAWGEIASNLQIWLYQMNYKCYPDYFDYLAGHNNDLYKMLLVKGANMIYNQGTRGPEMNTFHSLHEYVYSNLMWDCNRSIPEMIDKYFDAMFLDASETMKEIFNTMRRYDHFLGQDDRTNESTSSVIYQDMYPYQGFLLPLCNMYEKAYSEIEKYKTTNNGLYHLLRSRIGFEYSAPLFFILTQHASSVGGVATQVSAEKLYEYKQKMVEILNYSDICYVEQNTVMMSSLFGIDLGD